MNETETWDGQFVGLEVEVEDVRVAELVVDVLDDTVVEEDWGGADPLMAMSAHPR